MIGKRSLMTDSNYNNNLTPVVSTTSARDQAQQKYEILIRRDYRRNFFTYIMFNFFWGMGMGFAMYFTMVAVYLTALKTHKALFGTIMAFHTIFCPLQLLVAHWFRNRSRKMWCIIIYLASVIPWLIYNIIFLTTPQLCTDGTKLILFTFVLIFFTALITSGDLNMLSMVTDAVPVKKRGTTFGCANFALSVGVCFMIMPARWIMKGGAELGNFHLSFMFGNIMYILAIGSLWFFREHSNPTTVTISHHAKVNRLIPRLRLDVRKLIRDHNYKVFMFFAIFFAVAISLGSFLIVYAKEKVNISGSDILLFTLIHKISSAIFSPLLGKLADKVGYKVIGVIQGVLLGIAFVIMAGVGLVPTLPRFVVYISFALYAGVFHVAIMVFLNLSVELRPKQSTGVLLALGNLFLMPAVLVAAPLSGLLIEVTGSYIIVFSLAALLSFISALGYGFFVQEPRKSKLYPVRIQ